MKIVKSKYAKPSNVVVNFQLRPTFYYIMLKRYILHVCMIKTPDLD